MEQIGNSFLPVKKSLCKRTVFTVWVWNAPFFMVPGMYFSVKNAGQGGLNTGAYSFPVLAAAIMGALVRHPFLLERQTYSWQDRDGRGSSFAASGSSLYLPVSSDKSSGSKEQNANISGFDADVQEGIHFMDYRTFLQEENDAVRERRIGPFHGYVANAGEDDIRQPYGNYFDTFPALY